MSRLLLRQNDSYQQMRPPVPLPRRLLVGKVWLMQKITKSRWMTTQISAIGRVNYSRETCQSIRSIRRNEERHRGDDVTNPPQLIIEYIVR
jgi:hypothetical protein